MSESVIFSGALVDVNDKALSIIFDSSLFSASDQTMNLGGVPLALAEYNGLYAPIVISISGVPVADDEFFLYGQLFQSKTISGRCIFPVSISVGSVSSPEGGLVWRGVPIARDGNSIVCVQNTSTENDEEIEVFLGGLPFLVRRIADRYHLVVNAS